MAGDEKIRALVEIPKGSRNKYEFDEETKEIEFDRRLFGAVSFPTDYRFVRDTRTEEGDPLDILVCVAEPTFPGGIVPVKVIALVKMRADDGRDDKVVGVPAGDPAWKKIDEIDGWGSSDEALEPIEDCRQRYREE